MRAVRLEAGRRVGIGRRIFVQKKPVERSRLRIGDRARVIPVALGLELVKRPVPAVRRFQHNLNAAARRRPDTEAHAGFAPRRGADRQSALRSPRHMHRTDALPRASKPPGLKRRDEFHGCRMRMESGQTERTF